MLTNMEVEILDHAKSYPGFTGEEHPEVFDIRAMLPQQGSLKPGQIPEHLVRQYFEKGFVVLDKFFTPEEINPCRDAIDSLVDDLAQRLHKAGKIKNLYDEFGFFERLTKIEHEFPGAVVILHKLGKLPQAFRNLWSNERLLNLIEQIIGPDISGSPNWNFRTKVPNTPSMDVPWHQDSAYLDSDSYKVLFPTVWIPFLDANKVHGCMEMIEGGHRKGLIAPHKCCVGDTWYIKVEDEEMKDKLGVDAEKDGRVCPIPYGGLLLFNNLIPHRSLPNFSDSIRWSVDLRFLRTDQPVGLFGLKKAVVLRSSREPNMTIDWESFDAVDRNQAQAMSVKDIVKVQVDDEFDTTIQGPWMKKWEIVHHNSHVLAFKQIEENKRQVLTF